eukprot:TRINITY_DN2681_c0_g1_i2.p2 TRINITY_DN2681_c0_g1~~TRINITY_DN2681_c0_g1_i2.p2  ORF type:complete len:226 (-),score=18.69 TRINITY_DN2681_c0_g1_i2:42-719(-)
MSFYKFPRTPHIAGSAVVDDDCVLSAQQLKAQLQSLCHPAGHSFAAVIQEKVDGANVGVHFEDEEHRWLPTCQKRGGVIGTHEKAQYNVFQSWCAEHAEELWESLHADYVLFGEWLWCTHAIRFAPQAKASHPPSSRGITPDTTSCPTSSSRLTCLRRRQASSSPTSASAPCSLPPSPSCRCVRCLSPLSFFSLYPGSLFRSCVSVPFCHPLSLSLSPPPALLLH